MENNKNLDIEKAKTMLVKQLYQKSFYGILGTHPKARKKDIESSFRSRITKIPKANKTIMQDGEFAMVLKAYAILTSSYKNNYDEYLENYKNGLIKAVDLLYSDKKCLDEFVKAMQPWATGMQPWSVFMQPWATGRKVSMQP